MGMSNEGKIKEAEVLQRATYLKAQKMATEKNPFKYSDEQRRYYKTFGGTPHLDAQYTVFGELVDGFNVLDEIAKVETGVADRPKEDVVVLKMKIIFQVDIAFKNVLLYNICVILICVIVLLNLFI